MGSDRMNRRKFLKTGTSLVALGGGVFWLGAGQGARAFEAAQAMLNQQGFAWPLPTPRQLSDVTHALAQRAIGGEFGRSMKAATFSLDEAHVAGLSANMRYAQAARLVAEQAPLRILPGERIVGAATLLEGASHSTPVAGCGSTSHTTLGFDRALKIGYKGLRQQIDAQSAQAAEPQCITEPGRWGRAFAASATGRRWIEARMRQDYGVWPLTVECWVLLRSATHYNIIVAHKPKESRWHWELFSHPESGNLGAWLPGFRETAIDSGQPIADGQWHFVALTHDGARIRLFVDGRQAADVAAAATGVVADPPGPLYIGAYPPQEIYCDGLIDEVRISSAIRPAVPVPNAPFAPDAATVALWHFDEATGQGLYQDVSRLRNPGVPIVAGQAGLSPCMTGVGRFGQALAVDGALGRAAWATPQPAYDNPPLTVECWARLSSKSGFNILVANRNKESRCHWELYTSAGTGTFCVYLPGYSPNVIEAPRDIADNRWHCLAMVHGGSYVKLFIDGEPMAHVAVTPGGTLGDGGGLLSFGAYGPQSLSCMGQIDELRISNAVRDIRGIPSSPFPADANTIGLWRFDETAADRLYLDISATANHAFPSSQAGGGLVRAMRVCLDAAGIWHQRYLEQLDRLAAASAGEERANYVRARQALQNVPENPPTSFHEAVQSLWFMWDFQRLMGNWSGIGRIDEMLGPYLKKDLADGRITLDEAREILAHFWIKGCEWIGAFSGRGSGDAQSYQNIILSGVDAQGHDVTNEVTYLVLDIVEELHISDFPIAVRLNSQTPDQLLWRIAEVQRYGGGIVALYNEEVVIKSLVDFGYPIEEARGFANDGCWEMLIPGKTAFIYAPFDLLAILHGMLGLQQTLDPLATLPAYPDFEAFYGGFRDRLSGFIADLQRNIDGSWRSDLPAPLLALLVEGCLESGKGYHNCGAKYTVMAIHAGGMANVANSLLAIKRMVYEEKRLTLTAFVNILRGDWQGQEPLRQYVLSQIEAYGNDNDEADAMMARVYRDYTDIVWQVRERNGIKRPCGISTFGREIGWSFPGQGRGASPDGHRRGEILATNFSPSPGTDRHGPTAVLKSYTKVDLARVPGCATIELKVHPDSVAGTRGLAGMVALMRGFVALRGMFMHMDVVDTAMLRDAQAHPEKYPNLSVRVAGWSARFATLDDNWQRMVIDRTQQYLEAGSGNSSVQNWGAYQ